MCHTPAGVEAHQLVVSAQNHDQIGNRAQGERLSMLLGLPQLKAVAALTLLSPFVPLLFQGEEWGAMTPFLYFTDYEDPELGRMISEGRKKEFVAFGWAPDQIPDPQDEQTFLQSKLNWAELTEEPHRSLLQWHKDLISLRRNQSRLSDGNLNAVNVRFDEVAQWLVLERGNLRVACNLGNAPVELEIGDGSRILLASDDSIALSGPNIKLGPDSVAVMSIPEQG